MPPFPPFIGWPSEIWSFLTEFRANNAREWFHANRDDYDRILIAPRDALINSLAPRYGPAKTRRPHRDLRFSPDKSPYHTNVGVAFDGGPRGHTYVEIDADRLLLARGYYMPAPDQIGRYREAVAGPPGDALPGILADASGAGMAPREAELRRVPTNYSKDHPRADLLRYKTFTLWHDGGRPTWLHTPDAADHIAAAWEAAAPFVDWLAVHVGPSTLPPPTR